MSDDKVQVTSRGIGFSGLLTIVFITLKLTGVIDWHWIWVLAPLWASFVLVILAFGIAFLLLFIFAVVTNRR